MLYLAWFIFFFSILQLVVALTNLVFLPKLRSRNPVKRPLVSVLIPARDEENNIGNLLEDLTHQDYDNIELIVFNDLSADRTEEIVKVYAAKDNRIRLINGDNLPEGWLGKNWACHSLALASKGEYLLFLDADVRVKNGIIVKAVSYAQHFAVGLVSIFPRQIMKTTGEKITVPLMNYILLSLLPLILVRKSPFPSIAAANGQFMFFNSMIYKSFHPHKKLKDNKVEDIEIARYFKKNNCRTACLIGDSTIQCRMYNGFSDAAAGFSKNVSAFFGNSLTLASLFWIVTTFGFLPVLSELSTSAFLAYLTVIILTRIIISIESEQNVAENLLLLIPQQLSLGLIIYNAFIYRNVRTYRWKGREIK